MVAVLALLYLLRRGRLSLMVKCFYSRRQAPSLLEASIRKGSVGKWGREPMPPYPGLSEAQVKALAEFVLKQ